MQQVCYHGIMSADMITFKSPLSSIGKRMIVRLPETASEKLPSRGQVSVAGTVNGTDFQTVLEPDGRWGHWFNITDAQQKELAVAVGDVLTVEIQPRKEWPEPTIPKDFQQALAAAPQKVKDKWRDITPMARWEWVRWVNATNNLDTRDVRIEKSISKLSGKHRRPCCFNLAACTDMELSKSGRLIEA